MFSILKKVRKKTILAFSQGTLRLLKSYSTSLFDINIK